MDARSPQNRRNATRVVRATNAQILVMAESLDRGEGEQAIAFFCECGCLDIIPMTVTRYKTIDGAWLPGHKPEP